MPQDNGFEIRFEDPRIGYFTDRVTDLSSTEITPYRDLIQKWNLQKQNPDAAKSKPIKPIKNAYVCHSFRRINQIKH